MLVRCHGAVSGDVTMLRTAVDGIAKFVAKSPGMLSTSPPWRAITVQEGSLITEKITEVVLGPKWLELKCLFHTGEEGLRINHTPSKVSGQQFF